MARHRVHLDDSELALIVAALKARASGVRGDTRRKILYLAERLNECSPGNPEWSLIPGAAAADATNKEAGAVPRLSDQDALRKFKAVERAIAVATKPKPRARSH